jgi:UDP-2,4-diacetamido-2,4,6-trideoxy-beta-L-altropyranose hydrolase
MTQNIAFRVDASSAIGTGHLMRCLALADELSSCGAKIHFVCRHLLAPLQSVLIQRGFQFSKIGSDLDPPALEDMGDRHAAWLGTLQHIDSTQSIAALAGDTWDWLIVDHYALDAEWEKALRCVALKIAVIDDLFDRSHDCDLLLNQNFNSDENEHYSRLVSGGCIVRLGPRFALLRDEFQNFRRVVKARSGKVDRILVFFGGIDFHNYTGVVLEALEKLRVFKFAVDVVVGSQHPRLDEILQKCAANDFVCHVQTDRMPELIATADLAVGAGGIALWERCCLGLPSLVVPTADNQSMQVFEAALRGLVYAPSSGVWDKELFIGHLRSLLQNPCLLRFVSQQCLSQVDGRGSNRIANDLMYPTISIRRAIENDSRKIYAWRNEQVVRMASRNSKIISWSDHKRWFDEILRDKNRCLLIGEFEEQSVGVIRFNLDDDTAEVSIYLASNWIGRGVGKLFLQSAELWLVDHVPRVHKLKAVVLGENSRSWRLFEESGYSLKELNFIKEVD